MYTLPPVPRGGMRGNDFTMQYLPVCCDPVILGVYFYCILDTADTTGHFQKSRALAEMVHELDLKDTWNQNPPWPAYTSFAFRHHLNR